MIRTYRHNGLEELAKTGSTAKINAKFHARCIEILGVINRATDVRDLNQPGYRLHQLKQFSPVRFSVRVLGAWRITFEWDKGYADRVDLEQYH